MKWYDDLKTEPEYLPRRKTHKRQRVKRNVEWCVDGVLVSDHAVVRYLEAVHGINVKSLRAEIVAQGRAEIIKQLKTCRIPVAFTGAKLVVRDGLVVTVSKQKQKYRNKDDG